MSATIPPGYSGTLDPGQAPGSVPPTATGSEQSAPTSVLPENEALCAAVVQRAQRASMPDSPTDDAAELADMKQSFATFVDLAPTSIKPEIQAMSNVIQSLGSVSDLTRLDDPGFRANQERFAVFVKDNCGVDLPG